MREILWRRPERRLPTLALFGAAVALLTALAVSLAQGGSPARAQDGGPAPAPLIPAELVLDHFTCYDVAPDVEVGPTLVVLADQFGTVTTTLAFRSAFCAPTVKTRLDTSEVRESRFPFAHLTCYDLAAVTPAERVVRTEDQFGSHELVLPVEEDQELDLCAPTRKIAVDGEQVPPPSVAPEAVLDHYLCYETSRPLVALPRVVLRNQFEVVEEGFDQEPTEQFCNPVAKTRPDTGKVSPIKFPFAHLTCHKFATEEEIESRTIEAEDQFGPYTIGPRLIREYLCTPSMKEGAPPPPPELVLNHFKCYQITGKFDKRSVFLTDQFEAKETLVKKVDSLCNPVEKRVDGRVTPIRDSRAHLKCYDITEEKGEVKGTLVEVTHQLATERLTVQKQHSLCTPSSKSATAADPGPVPANLDHFKCYDVKGERQLQRTVVLTDQFHSEEVVVQHALLLCNPVEKRHDGQVFRPQFPFAHLVCYQITERGPFGPRDVRVRNQFGLEETRVVSPRTLCLPATKRVI